MSDKTKASTTAQTLVAHLVKSAQARVLQPLHQHAQAAQAREHVVSLIRFEKVLHDDVRDDVTRGLGILVAREGDPDNLAFLQVAEAWAATISGVDCGVDLCAKSVLASAGCGMLQTKHA